MRATNQFWLLKTEPEVYSFADLQRDGATVWDGVTNAQALQNIRAMQPGDQALIYHSGDERRAVGIAEVTSAAYADPRAADPKLAVVDVRPLRALVAPVTLAAIKADAAFAASALVRQGRLSVVSLPPELWARLLALGGEQQ